MSTRLMKLTGLELVGLHALARESSLSRQRLDAAIGELLARSGLPLDTEWSVVSDGLAVTMPPPAPAPVPPPPENVDALLP